ncbi:non-specific serine/threonine protein kinase [Teratosphaeria nubilosa]|uniref:non-specific serine/threonine protein kinase n=1 Tax=Teratosphaeria nubilosa TaxID=161662 RepID=A0A6G1KYL0_9PEZI|nr:non-specific serine/threonine protein kinase [Teratosphaeria nubilosa]
MALSRLRKLSLFRLARTQPWPASSAIAERIDPSRLIEEETSPYHHSEQFYPAKLGDILHGRYQIATKLGHGACSTVWLARDLCGWRWQRERYVAIKILSNGQCAREEGAESELAILKRIAQANPRHKGWHFVRNFADSFHVNGISAPNLCLVFEPLREPLWLYQRRYIGGVIPSEILKILLHMILHGLDYLHTECQLIHTDLKPDNIIIKLEDDTILDRDAQKEHLDPLPQKHIDGRIIYLARNDYGKLAGPTGPIQIVDFDRSVVGNVARYGPIQAEVYRAPGVIVDAGYSYPADIWSLGVMLWDLLEDKMLFRECFDDKTKDIDEHQHLAHMTALLGPRPTELTSGRRLSKFYDANGCLREADRVPRSLTLESTIRNISGEEKEMFLRFVRRMLKWKPEERSTAKELLDDPWLALF